MTEQILMVLAPQDFRDEELLVPRQAFEQAGFTVKTVSTQTGPATGMLGATENITQTLADIAASPTWPQAYVGIVIVGGMGSVTYLWQNPTLHQLLRQADEHNKLLAAICLSGVVLAKAGLLSGKRATVWESPESMAAYEQAHVSYTAEPLTVDGRLVTANGPEAAEAFAQAVLHALQQSKALTTK